MSFARFAMFLCATAVGLMSSAVERFASEVPFYMVRGNNEGCGAMASRCLEYFPTATGIPYYTFRQGPVFFVVLDGGEDKPDNDIECFGLNRMDRYREAGGESGAKFPVIINSNVDVDVIEATADERSLELSVRDRRGKEILHHAVERRR